MTGDDTLKYNPLDKTNLGISVAEALLRQPVHPLGEIPGFRGAGIYAIYYTGEFAAYGAIAERNRGGRFDGPIYVGKAVPPGSRRGGSEFGEYRGNALCGRLREHAESIRAVKNLQIEDFFCRYLVVDDIWIPLGEALLIARFSPIWNRLVDGFGNHDPGKGRYAGLRPRWDTLHPGRPWAERCQQRQEAVKQIELEIADYLVAAPNGTEDDAKGL